MPNDLHIRAGTSTTVAYIFAEYPDGERHVIGEWDPVRRQYVVRLDHWLRERADRIGGAT